MIEKLHHVGIAVRDLDTALRFYRDQLGLRVARRVTLADRGLEVMFLDAGDSRIELLQPITEDNTVRRFLDRRGEGLHHLCFQSDNIRGDITAMTSLGAEFIDSEPRPGAEGEVAFIQPACAAGVLVELAEISEPQPAGEEEWPWER